MENRTKLVTSGLGVGTSWISAGSYVADLNQLESLPAGKFYTFCCFAACRRPKQRKSAGVSQIWRKISMERIFSDEFVEYFGFIFKFWPFPTKWTLLTAIIDHLIRQLLRFQKKHENQRDFRVLYDLKGFMRKYRILTPKQLVVGEICAFHPQNSDLSLNS